MEQSRASRNEPIHWRLIYNKEGKKIQWIKDNKWCWENWKATCRRIKLNYSLTPCKKINSKWIKGLKVRPETIKEGKHRQFSLDISLSNILNLPPQARGAKAKAKINQWDYIKVKRFCTAKETQQNEKSPTKWEKIFANGMSNGLISKIYKELIQLRIQKSWNASKQWAGDSNRHFSKYTQMAPEAWEDVHHH